MKDKIKELFKIAKDKALEAKALLEADEPNVEKANELLAEAEKLREQAKALKAAQGIISEVGEPQLPAALPMGPEGGEPLDRNAAIKAIHNLRFGEPEAAVKAILRDLHGADYETKRWKQWQVFNRWLRRYQDPVIPPEGREFLWTPESIKLALREGQDVMAMKTTMVEAQDTLGGYIVPDDYRADVIQRMMGYVIMRQRATILTTSRDAVEIPTATGGDAQYTSAVRVTWVDETPANAAASATNLTFGLERISVHTVMANTDISRNLIEDAAFNLASYLAEKFAEAAGIDEDNRFLTGDGNGKPQGLLPSSANDLSLAEDNTGNASALEWDGLIALKYSINSQYRQKAVFIMEKATVEAIAKLQDGSGNYLWRYGLDNVGDTPPRLLGHEVLEQEAMPTIAADAYPILFGDPRGYYIVDRVGMSIERYIDSATAVTNTVKYVLRRRLGGQCAETWRFGVQKVSA